MKRAWSLSTRAPDYSNTYCWDQVKVSLLANVTVSSHFIRIKFCSSFPHPNSFADRVRELSSASGFDVNAAVDGRSPLHFAADYGQLEVIEFLVEKVIFPTK